MSEPRADATPETRDAGPSPRRKRRRWGRGFLLILFLVGLLVGGAAAALIKSGPGQRMVLDFVLDQARQALAGELAVDSLRSSSLLGGAMLVGVRLDAADGRAFLTADSVRVRYSILSLFGPVPRIARLSLFGPRVEISRYPGEEALNVTRLVAPAPVGADTAATRRGVALGSIRVVDGLVEVLTPLTGPGGGFPTVPSPVGEGELRRLGLEGIQLEVEDVRLGGGDDLFAGRLTELVMDVRLLHEPIRVRHVEGTVRFGDAGLTLEEGAFRMPASAFDGGLSLGPREGVEGWVFSLALRTQGPASLADLAWMDPRIPEGVLRGGVSVTTGDGVDVALEDVRVELEASRLTVDGSVRLGDGAPRLDDLVVQASPLALARLEPWLDQELPADGWISGNVRLAGRMAALSVDGRMTLVPTGFGGLPTTADLRGTLHFGRNPGVTSLRAVLDPLNLVLLEAVGPGLGVTGGARAEIEASGRVDDGIRFVADMGHAEGTPQASHVLLRGSARRGGGAGWTMDVQGDVSPLSMELLDQLAPALASVGGIQGSVRAVGALSDLQLTGDLEVAEGRLTLESRADLTDPGRSYRLDAALDGVRISSIVEALPDPSRWSGRLRIEGRGVSPDSMEARGTLEARASRIGGLHVDSLMGAIRVAHGVLAVDTLSARLGGMRVEGTGDLGLSESATGRARLAFHTDDLVGLRPLLLGDTVLARDTLSVLDRQLLRLQGVDADTLPLLADVAMSGRMEGTVDLTGTLSQLDVEGAVTLREAVYGSESVGTAHVRFTARDVLQPGRMLDLQVEAEDLVAFDRSLATMEADVRFEERAGDGTLSAVQTTGERYALAGAFAFDSAWAGGTVRLDRATVEVDDLPWVLGHPTTVRWDSAAVTVDSFAVTREGDDPMLLRASGTLAWEGSSDLVVDARGVHLDRVARLLQREEWELEGHADLSLRVTGPAAAPSIEGTFAVGDPAYGDMTLTSMDGELRYRDRQATVRLEARAGDRRVFRAGGTVPVDLAIRTEGRRVVPRSMDVTVEADSMDAAVALGIVGLLEDVDGVVSGEFRIRGPLDRPEPSGVLRLEGGAWSIEAMGVRHTGLEGSLTLHPDGEVEVEVDGRARGTSRVRGRVVLEPVTDPRLDLTLTFQGFQAVERRDVAGLMSGEVKLMGTYTAPRVEGSLTVDQGTLFLEEFVRSAGVVDLTDPRIFEVVDTAALSTRPLLAEIRNPFLENLRVDVDLSVPRDTWLRSEDMNVEIGGSLLVRYDRMNRDVVMVGELQALRGTYTVLGRRFEVEEGTVGFIGTPGINPTLDIQAVTRIRRMEGGPLPVTANVQGTLTQPRVTLSTDEQGVAESDLVSYLIFGRPSYELASGQEAWLQGTAGSVLGAATGAGVTYLSGTLATRLGAALSQQIGVDYLSITQAGDFGVASGGFLGTTVEVGQYLGDKVFFVLIFRPLSGQGGTQDFFGGGRVEVALTDDYNFQAFWEDRFLRSRPGGFGDLAIQAREVVGVFIFREWGY